MPAMTLRRILAALATLAAAAAVLVLVLPASSGSGGLAPGAIADVVALIHHDQQGIVLAHQAEAQSPDGPTRIRATALADDFDRQARALSAVLDAHRVPIRNRLVDTTHLDVGDQKAMGCDLVPKDAVSNLAATAPVDFDARFTLLMGRHLVGGIRMAAAVDNGDGLTSGQRVAIQRPQRTLA